MNATAIEVELPTRPHGGRLVYPANVTTLSEKLDYLASGGPVEYEGFAMSPLRFTRRRMARTRRRYNAARRRWPDPSASSIRWDTFSRTEQALIALDLR
jgi:hypothetical protein